MALKGRQWLNNHIETFIKPELKKWDIPFSAVEKMATGPKCPESCYLQMLKEYPKTVETMMALWEQAKKNAKGRTILLPGRDAWLFEVLARLDGTDTLFKPEISSLTKGWAAKFDVDKDRFKKCYCIDSGVAGSVPKALGAEAWGLVSGANRLLPGDQWTANCYSVLEALPKYWTRGCLDKPGSKLEECKIVQKIAGDSDYENETNKATMMRTFAVAAAGTIFLAEAWLKVHPEGEVFEPEPEPVILKPKLKRKRLSTEALLKRHRLRTTVKLGATVPTRLTKLRIRKKKLTII